MKIPMGVIVGVLLGGVAQAGIAPVGFETKEGFHTDASVNGLAGWVSDPAATVVATDSQFGSQSLLVVAGKDPAAVTRVIAPGEWGKKPIGYYDFWVKPTADASESPQTSIAADGAELAFIKDGDHGAIAAYSAAAAAAEGRSVLSKVTFSIDASNNALDWMRITIREDYGNRTWDVYVNGQLALINLGLDGKAARPTAFSMTIPSGQSMGLDAWQLSEQQVLFKDSDDDGMPDDFESANGLNPFVNDRNADPDGDGMSNIEEFQQGRSPGQPGVGNKHLVYVSNQSGSDVNTGALPYPAGKSGPMATIKAAMAAANNDDVIVVLHGKGTYAEGSRGVKGKALTIKTVGPVIIK